MHAALSDDKYSLVTTTQLLPLLFPFLFIACMYIYISDLIYVMLNIVVVKHRHEFQRVTENKTKRYLDNDLCINITQKINPSTP